MSPIDARKRFELVDVAAPRAAFEDSGMTASDVCRRLGRPFVLANGRANPTALTRTLGIHARMRAGGSHYFQKRLNYDTAVAIVRACGKDPVDYGL